MISLFYSFVYYSTLFFTGLWVSLYLIRKKRFQSNIPITSRDVAYDTARFGSILTWTSRSLIIHGQPTLIVAGEFHYWRIPDRTRWFSMLRHYKGAGLNCIRIPMHWGYHSPNQGRYYFDGNRDVGFLLDLCCKLNLFVIAVPGPYIGCDTQAGGLPLWLVAKKEVRLRHLSQSFWKTWDSSYDSFSKEWLQQILPVIAPFQITTSKSGCVIAVQLENKLIENILNFPLFLADELKSLALSARELDITVPLLCSDLMEEGDFADLKMELNSTSPKLGFWKRFQAPKFGLDLYGLTKNILPPPPLKPGGGLLGSSSDEAGSWELWDPSEIFKTIDHLEEKSKLVGSLACQSPLTINELQAGWSNPPGVLSTYDDLYTYYGSGLTRLLLESVLAQGCSIVSLYTPYGGTNWGTLGSPETYTSYDYAGCIREYGHLSGQYRKLRLSLLFIKSFSEFLLDSDRDYVPFNTVSESDIMNVSRLVSRFQDRQGLAAHKPNQAVELVFFRNFNDKESSNFDVQLNLTDELQLLDGHEPFFMSCQLPFKQSFIGVGNYTTANKLTLKFATKPIYARHRFRRNQRDCELWIVAATESLFSGELAFEGTVDSVGSLGVDFRIEDNSRITLMSFEEGPGWVGLSPGTNSGASSGMLYIVALDGTSLDSLYGAFRDSSPRLVKDDSIFSTPFLLGWGAYGMEFDATSDQLHVRHLMLDQSLVLLLPEYEDSVPPPGFQASSTLNDLPFAYERKLDFPKDLVPAGLRAQLVDCEKRTSQFNQWNWVDLKLVDGKPSLTPLELGSNSVSAYRCILNTCLNDPDLVPRVLLHLSVRHRFTLFVNQVAVATGITMNQSRLRTGSVSGPDLMQIETPTPVDISNHLVYPNRTEGGGAIENEIIILVDSLGISQMSLVFDDARNPRGLISASFQGLDNQTILSGSPAWQIHCIDSRLLSNPYSTSGLFEEDLMDSPVGENGWGSCEIKQFGQPESGVTWYRARFRHPLADQKLVVRLGDEVDTSIECPLQVSINGNVTAFIWINNNLVGRYYGDQLNCQSQFYLMDGLLNDDPDQDNLLCLAIFPISQENIHPVSVQVGGYCIDLDVVGFSGNRLASNQGGRDFLLACQSLPLSSKSICPTQEIFDPMGPTSSK